MSEENDVQSCEVNPVELVTILEKREKVFEQKREVETLLEQLEQTVDGEKESKALLRLRILNENLSAIIDSFESSLASLRKETSMGKVKIEPLDGEKKENPNKTWWSSTLTNATMTHAENMNYYTSTATYPRHAQNEEEYYEKIMGGVGNVIYPKRRAIKEETDVPMTLPTFTDVFLNNRFYVEMWTRAPKTFDPDKVWKHMLRMQMSYTSHRPENEFDDYVERLPDIPPQIVEKIWIETGGRASMDLRMLDLGGDEGKGAFGAVKEILECLKFNVIKVHQLNAHGKIVATTTLNDVTVTSMSSEFSYSNKSSQNSKYHMELQFANHEITVHK